MAPLLAEAHRLLSLVLLVAAVLGCIYLCIALWATAAFARRRDEPTADLPHVTVLKPVCGLEEGLYESLASFCDQDYPQFEVIFCVHEPDDPALQAIERVVADFPQCETRIAVGDNPAHRNPKIANLSKGAAAARGDVVVIADSDILAGRDYLRSLAAAFASPKTGAVTCLYRGEPAPGTIPALGAMYVEEQFAPSVLVTVTLGTLRFCLGATMAVRKRVLDAIGGIDALGPFLADDHKLGELVAAHGHTVALSRYVVATRINERTLDALWSHELRWARTSFVLAPVGYAFSFLIFAFPLALLYLAASFDLGAGLALVATAFALRIALHYVARAALHVRRTGTLALVPVRDCLSFAIWAASLVGRRVRWRGTHVAVTPDGQMNSLT